MSHIAYVGTKNCLCQPPQACSRSGDDESFWSAPRRTMLCQTDEAMKFSPFPFLGGGSTPLMIQSLRAAGACNKS